jgi:hypothetical protein
MGKELNGAIFSSVRRVDEPTRVESAQMSTRVDSSFAEFVTTFCVTCSSFTIVFQLDHRCCYCLYIRGYGY